MPPPGQNRNAGSDDDPASADIDDLRRELMRRVADIKQAWRICRRPSCRRARRCVVRTRCAGLATLRQPPAHKRAAILAHVHRRIQRMVAAARVEPDDR